MNHRWASRDVSSKQNGETPRENHPENWAPQQTNFFSRSKGLGEETRCCEQRISNFEAGTHGTSEECNLQLWPFQAHNIRETENVKPNLQEQAEQVHEPQGQRGNNLEP